MTAWRKPNFRSHAIYKLVYMFLIFYINNLATAKTTQVVMVSYKLV